MSITLRTVAVAAAILAGGPGHAARLDFSVFSDVDQGNQIDLTNVATVDAGSGTDALVVDQPTGSGNFGTRNSVCGRDSNSQCRGDFSITWDFDVKDINLVYGSQKTGKQADIEGFDSDGGSSGVETLSSSSDSGKSKYVDLSTLGTIRTLQFTDKSTGNGGGYAFGDITYTAVPLPPSLPMLAFVLGGLGVAGRRRLRG